MHNIHRRRFLQGAAAALAGAAAFADEPKGEGVLAIIDTHQHLWDLKKFELPWLKNEPTLARSYLPADYAKAIGELATSKPPAKVVKSVYMEVDVALEQQQAEADYVLDICKGGKTTMVAGVVSGRPAQAEAFATYVKQFKDSPYIKGIRQVLHGASTKAGYCLQKDFIKSIQLLGELGLSFDLCMRSTELLDAAKLVDECPHTRFVLDHCGNADVKSKDRTQWKKDIAEVAKRKNVVGKISGIVASAPPGKWTPDDLAPIIHHTREVFGPDRVMFAGDWPVCTLAASYRQWVDALRSVVKERPAEEQKKLFHDNAMKFYRLG
jgi:L-fuconolactonase